MIVMGIESEEQNYDGKFGIEREKRNYMVMEIEMNDK
jgi:hypothetical protein